jgi:hypothetical protein
LYSACRIVGSEEGESWNLVNFSLFFFCLFHFLQLFACLARTALVCQFMNNSTKTCSFFVILGIVFFLFVNTGTVIVICFQYQKILNSFKLCDNVFYFFAFIGFFLVICFYYQKILDSFKLDDEVLYFCAIFLCFVSFFGAS